MKIVYETSLNHANMHIFLNENYEDDYQLAMIRQNKIQGILAVEGCEIEGETRYTYEISGYTSMQKIYEKRGMKKEELLNFVNALLDIIERIQNFMLEPNNLVLNPECIYQKEGEWYLSYLPGNPIEMNKAFHYLSEYFVKTVDYEDTDAILLAYELHKASFQEHYSLRQILTEYEKRGKERDVELEELRKKQKLHENIFSLMEEEEAVKPKSVDESTFTYNYTPPTTTIREDDGVWQYRVKKKKQPGKKRWGLWDDLILESDD